MRGENCGAAWGDSLSQDPVCCHVGAEPRTRAPKAQRGIPRHGERTVVLPGRTPCPRILFAAVWGRSPECERLKRNAVSRDAGRELWCCLGGLLVPGSCLLPCGGRAQNAST
ncbi:hypothetical protein NDU88_000306 [Pleurodeles waltl]|uniref:Uncharacterized protein n=1 Tax=Pleurodeles waltl TaxID=8319 RepID=A0AAV7WJ07_PLEWA|nr:hypothetical protein NDU88_000306 [Pleurodeles waltl]